MRPCRRVLERIFCAGAPTPSAGRCSLRSSAVYFTDRTKKAVSLRNSQQRACHTRRWRRCRHRKTPRRGRRTGNSRKCTLCGGNTLTGIHVYFMCEKFQDVYFM